MSTDAVFYCASVSLWNKFMMFRVVFCVLLACFFVVVTGLGDSMIGKGEWEMKMIQKCEDDEKYPYRFKVEKRKVNRTHDGFNAWLTLEEVVDDSFAIRIDVCKYVDGGCKDYQKLSDDSIVNFIKKFAEENLKGMLALAGVEPPDFPIQKGEYEVLKYVFDYCELPCKAVYGEFKAIVVMINTDNVEVGCIVAEVEFREHGDAEPCPNCED